MKRSKTEVTPYDHFVACCLPNASTYPSRSSISRFQGVCSSYVALLSSSANQPRRFLQWWAMRKERKGISDVEIWGLRRKLEVDFLQRGMGICYFGCGAGV